MITTLNTRKLLTLAGLFLLAAVAMVIPMDAFASGLTGTNTNLADQATDLATASSSWPKLMAIFCYVIGAFFIIRALFSMKGFIESPDDNPISKVLSFAGIGAVLVVFPTALQMVTGSLGADTGGTLTDAAAVFQDSATMGAAIN